MNITQIQKFPKQNLSVNVEKLINKSTFKIYLAKCPKNSKSYALKVFEYEEEEMNTCFARELPATTFNHINVIKVFDFNPCIQTEVGTENKGMTSYTIMELAPFGNLGSFLQMKSLAHDEKLIRTIFRHICEGVKYIHYKDYAHMALKLESIVFGENYIPKIADFDSLKKVSRSRKDVKIMREGIVNFRAPEVVAEECKDGCAADLYSLGVILFMLVFRFRPYIEDYYYYGYNLGTLMQESSPEFFKVHIGSKRLVLSDAYKDLVLGLTRKVPNKRLSFHEVYKNDWFAGPVYDETEYAEIMKGYLG